MCPQPAPEDARVSGLGHDWGQNVVFGGDGGRWGGGHVRAIGCGLGIDSELRA